ncbi:protein adenylyltransferase SelO-like [Ischnura elegans]|uniref:protein adenylyltransferase SelO-like n=1 Tax=Ischnura elegans TaxID=197161 RepID=UPI001ED8783E|nr:protein adenylyltransferase SelO-like [Ischnura elegans]
MNQWKFSASKLLQLPLDPILENYVRQVKNAVFSIVLPTPLETEVKLIAYSDDVVKNILDLEPDVAESKDFVEFVAGNKILESCAPLAHRYGGHQFGVWAGQLGDGRAHLLGEYVNRKGERWELQLKGSGKSPYSRGADGRAVIRSSIREFLCAEAMHYLGVPTSRVAAIVCSHDPVIRDRFYDGNPRPERAAVVLRLAPTWFRFGSLEILAKSFNEWGTLKILAQYLVQTLLPKDVVQNSKPKDSPKLLLELLKQVAEGTWKLAVYWEIVGFVHGVLNTDNLSLGCVTIDYGPFGFVEAYNTRFIPNTSDSNGRYSLRGQWHAIDWDLQRLADALAPLLCSDDNDSEGEEDFTDNARQILEVASQKALVMRKYAFCAKLGLACGRNWIEVTRGGSLVIDEDTLEDDDLFNPDELVEALLKMMEETKSDFTMTFRQLGEEDLCNLTQDKIPKHLWAVKKLSEHSNYQSFLSAYQERLDSEGVTEQQRRSMMSEVNPCYVLRNWMAEEAIRMAETDDDYSRVRLLLKVLSHPYEVQKEAEEMGYSNPTPAWASCIRVSCSS